MQRQIAQQGPAIDRYMTQQQSLSQQTAGGMEFRDCQNPDASDGYVVGPDEKVPGYAPDYIKSQPHRELTDEEYGLPKGTVLMATQQEQSKGEVPLISEPPDILDPEEQVKQWFKESGATPWTGQNQAHFANGEPVPSKFGMPNYNPAMDPAYRHQQQMSYGFGRSPPMYASSPPPGSARPMDVTGYNHIQRTSHMGHG